jgi:hypothetical protein
MNRDTIYSGITRSGNAAFGKLNPSNRASDFIRKQSVQAQYARPLHSKATNYNDLYKIKQSLSIQNGSSTRIIKDNTLLLTRNNIMGNKNNLISSLYTELSLPNVPVVSDLATGTTPAKIDPIVEAPYLFYNVDASGKLFGNTRCGIANYLNYKKGRNFDFLSVLNK